MAIKKNAAKADIGPKKQVKATFAECTAKEPLKCKYHGLKALDKLIGNILASSGHSMPFVTDKHDNEYELRLPGDIDLPMSTFSKISLSLANKGFSIYNKGQTEEGAFKYQIKPVDGKEFVTPEDEAELEDADMLSSTDAPEKKNKENKKKPYKDPFAELENMDVDALIAENELDADLLENFDDLDEIDEEATEDLEAELLGNNEFDDEIFTETADEDRAAAGLTDEDIKNLVSFNGVTDEHFETQPELIGQYKAIITTGKNASGSDLTPSQKEWWQALVDKTKSANLDELPALKVLKETMAKVNGGGEQGGNDITEEDCKKLVEAAGYNPDDYMDNAPSIWQKTITTGNGISDTNVGFWKNIAQKAEQSGESLAALPVLKDTLAKFDKLNQVSSTQNHEAEMQKYATQWNNLMDTAVNGKKLMGTEYWGEKIAPIVDLWNKAIGANEADKAFDALYELKEAVKNASANGEKPTKDSLIAEMGNVIAKMKGEGLDLTWDVKKGNALGKAFEDAINADDIAGAEKALKDFKDYVEFLENGGDAPESVESPVTESDIKDFFVKCGIKKSVLLGDDNLTATKEALETGKFKGKELTNANLKWYQNLAKKAPDHKVANAIEALIASKGGIKTKTKKGAKEALATALSGGDGAGAMVVSDEVLKPLEHDESKFPQNVTQKELEKAIEHPIKELGGHGGSGTRLIQIGDKQYVCKAATGTGASVIRNGYNADMAYRAGGVYAPDAQLYEFGDGKTYKLSEFIPGKHLIDVWQTADEAKRDEIRKELLKGYPLDVLFSNYDVLGTSPEDSITVTIQGADGKPQKTHVAFNHIMIGDDGHAYRVDNDGSFAMTGTGGIKNSSGGGYTTKVEAEKWGNWEDRQWIDDFRTMRRNEKNLGIFDRYSTADIFLSAGNINLNAVVGTLPQGIQDALAKPVFEMKQMTMRALSASLSGIKNDMMLSAALDASYEASKRNFREMCIGEISFSSGGIGAKESDKGEIPPYPVAKPQPPVDPTKKFAAGAMLTNAEYKGTKVSDIILSAAKTINYHAGFTMTDAQGNKLGGGNALTTPDYSPNSSKIAAFKKIDREKLVELAKTSESAKAVLDYYDSVATSMANGFKLPVQEVKQTNISESLPSGFKTKSEIDFEEHKEKVMAQYHADLKKYNEETLPQYNKDKKEWEEKEKAKLRSGEHGLEGNFYDIANEFMEAAYNTDGVVQHNGESIDFIELGKYQNKYGGEVEGATTHNDSWTPASSHLKVLDLLMQGRTLESIANISDNDPLVNNGHHSGKKAKGWFIGEAQQMLANPEQTRREMIAYAVFKGLQVVKLENETADVSLSTGGNVPWIDHGCHTVALIRKESFSNASENTIAPIVQKGGNVSCGFQSNGCIGIYPYAYDVPLWNIAYTYSDANHKGSKVASYKGEEHEWVANLVGITPFRVNSSTNASQNVNLARNNATIKKDRAKRTARLAPFFTKMADLKNIVKKMFKGH